MELIDGTHNNRLDCFVPMDLSSSIHSGSSDDLLVWCTGDDFESDTSLTSRILDHESRGQVSILSDADVVANSSYVSASSRAQLLLPEPFPQNDSLSETRYILPDSRRHSAHSIHSYSARRHESSNASPQHQFVGQVDYIETDVCHRSSVQLDTDVTTNRPVPNSTEPVCLLTENLFKRFERVADNASSSSASRYSENTVLVPVSSTLTLTSHDRPSGCSELTMKNQFSDIPEDRPYMPTFSFFSPAGKPNTNYSGKQSSDDFKTSSSQAAQSLCSFSSLVGNTQLFPSSGPIMLCQTSELASGDTLTCMLVNILRGLRLLDRCGLEDLCASLCNLHTVEQSVFHANQFHGSSASDIHTTHSTSELLVTRSSSFTSSSLISPSRSKMLERRLHSNTIWAKGQHSYCCIVDFILKCSFRGSTVPRSRDIRSLQGTDWRRGRATNVVTMLTSGPVNGSTNHSRTAVNRILTGRFLSGPLIWRSVWPWTSICFPGCANSDLSVPTPRELAQWLSVWIRKGAAIVLAELVDCEREAENEDFGKQGCEKKPESQTELLWRHRLIYGISEHNEVYLSNPVELVSLSYVLRELSRTASLKLHKSELTERWAEHQRHHTNVESSSEVFFTESGALLCTGDFSSLACQADPRWSQMNVLGQVLQTLRGLENSARTNFSSNHPVSSSAVQLEQSCLSPVIHIPCFQSPGFSVFVAKTDWELCHALHRSTQLFT